MPRARVLESKWIRKRQGLSKLPGEPGAPNEQNDSEPSLGTKKLSLPPCSLQHNAPPIVFVMFSVSHMKPGSKFIYSKIWNRPICLNTPSTKLLQNVHFRPISETWISSWLKKTTKKRFFFFIRSGLQSKCSETVNQGWLFSMALVRRRYYASFQLSSEHSQRQGDGSQLGNERSYASRSRSRTLNFRNILFVRKHWTIFLLCLSKI